MLNTFPESVYEAFPYVSEPSLGVAWGQLSGQFTVQETEGPTKAKQHISPNEEATLWGFLLKQALLLSLLRRMIWRDVRFRLARSWSNTAAWRLCQLYSMNDPSEHEA